MSDSRRVVGRDARDIAHPTLKSVEFTELCDRILEIRSARRHGLRLALLLLKSFRHLFRWADVLRRLPRVRVFTTASPEGRAIRIALRGYERGMPGWLAASMLDVPSDPKEYSKGRSRQALRTNCSRARKAGMHCRTMTDDEVRREVPLLLDARSDTRLASSVLKHVDLKVGTFWAVIDSTGDVRAMSLIIVDREVARLNWMMAANGPEQAEARYLLSLEMIESLASAGVRRLFVGSSLILEPGLRYFQHLLGFAPVVVTAVNESE